jgi:hypothetical protein
MQAPKTKNICQEEFEDTKGIIKIRKSKEDRQPNGQKKKEKQRSTKHYT